MQNIFSSLAQSDRGWIIVIVYNFLIWNKKNTRLLVVELLAVLWVPCILIYPILSDSIVSFDIVEVLSCQISPGPKCKAW